MSQTPTDTAFQPLDEEEKALMEALEKTGAKGLPPNELDKSRLQAWKNWAKSVRGEPREGVYVKFNQRELSQIRGLAREQNVPYQRIIQYAVHEYLVRK